MSALPPNLGQPGIGEDAIGAPSASRRPARRDGSPARPIGATKEVRSRLGTRDLPRHRRRPERGEGADSIAMRLPDEETIHFDVSSGTTLLGRLHSAGIPLEGIRHLFVSHRHFDHVGGLAPLLTSTISLPGANLTVHALPRTLTALRNLLGRPMPSDTPPQARRGKSPSPPGRSASYSPTFGRADSPTRTRWPKKPKPLSAARSRWRAISTPSASEPGREEASKVARVNSVLYS